MIVAICWLKKQTMTEKDTSYTYDGNGNLKTKTDAKGKTTTYHYNYLDLVSDIKYSDGKVVSYAYNKKG